MRVRQRIRLQPFPDFIHADVVQIVRAVGAPAELAVVLLLLFFLEQQFPELRHKRERPQAGSGLGRICHTLNALAVKIARRDGTLPILRQAAAQKLLHRIGKWRAAMWKKGLFYVSASNHSNQKAHPHFIRCAHRSCALWRLLSQLSSSLIMTFSICFAV